MTRDLVVHGGSVLGPDGWSERSVFVRQGRISSLGSLGEGTPVVDATGLRVVPGFVDLQVNGGWGFDFASNPASIWDVGQKLLETGVTAWLPTLVTTPEPMLDEALTALRERPQGWVGAEPLGWHLEGPWLDPSRKGAHRASQLRQPQAELPQSFHVDNGVVLVTLAPEVPGCLAATRQLVERGVVVSLGHSNADVQTARSGMEAGATMGTHLFNAMSGLHHREPGLAAALLTSDCSFGLIVDGIHVEPDMVRLAWQAASDRVVLVSDTMAGLGLPPGEVRLGRYRVLLDGSSARLEDGTLAGSVLDMPTAVANLVRYASCPLSEAVSAATRAPCDAIGDGARGRIQSGSLADLVLIDDDVNVVATILGGELVFEASQATSL